MMEQTPIGPLAKNTSLVSRTTAWALLLILFIAALAIVVIPVWIIRPLKAQPPEGLELAYTLRRWSPIVTLVVSAIAVALMVRLWRGARWWSRTALVLVFVVTLAAAWLARQNHFEWMFNPLPDAAFVSAHEASFVADTDMVLAVQMNGEAVAYPVRQMGYHHVVQDVVGGVPIAATY